MASSVLELEFMRDFRVDALFIHLMVIEWRDCIYGSAVWKTDCSLYNCEKRGYSLYLTLCSDVSTVGKSGESGKLLPGKFDHLEGRKFTFFPALDVRAYSDCG